MILYMLDTDIASYVIKSRYPEIQDRLAQLDASHVCISAVTRAELMFGLKRLPGEHRLQVLARRFLKTVKVLPWAEDAADFYAEIRHQLSTERQQIGDLDMMVAAHSLAVAAILVTNNTRHYARIAAPLMLENWVTSEEVR